jgi:hypothetical protein
VTAGSLLVSNNKQHSYIERAFDKVWVTGLVSKPVKAGLPAHFVHIKHNYLNNGAIAVHRNSETDRRHVQARVPQGSLLQPALFNFSIDD